MSGKQWKAARRAVNLQATDLEDRIRQDVKGDEPPFKWYFKNLWRFWRLPTMRKIYLDNTKRLKLAMLELRFKHVRSKAASIAQEVRRETGERFK